MDPQLRNALIAIEGELLQTGHWSPAEDFLIKLSERLSILGYTAKDLIAVINRGCPGIVEFRVLRNADSREQKYLVKSLVTTRKKFRGYPLRSEIDVLDNTGHSSRRAREKYEELPAHIGAMGNWKPLQITNMSAALRAGKGCIAATSDFVLDEGWHQRTTERTYDEWQGS